MKIIALHAARANRSLQGRAFLRCKCAWHRKRSFRALVEERVRPTEPAQPPAKKRGCATREERERERRRRVCRQRAGGGALVDSTKLRAEHLIAGAAIGLWVHEGMNEPDHGKARARRVGDRSSAAFRVPAEHSFGELQAAKGISARGQLHPTDWHLENVRSAR